MQLQGVIKALLTLVTAVSCASATSGQEMIQSSAILVSSPDAKYEAFWVDLTTTQHSLPRRLIFVVDALSNELLFTHSTFQRRTGVVWNNSSTACAIFDAPDNANVYLWILTKEKSTSPTSWSVKQIDLEKMATQIVPDVFLEKTVRTGIEKVSWEGEETLDVQVLVNGRSLSIKASPRERGNGVR